MTAVEPELAVMEPRDAIFARESSARSSAPPGNDLPRRRPKFVGTILETTGVYQA